MSLVSLDVAAFEATDLVESAALICEAVRRLPGVLRRLPLEWRDELWNVERRRPCPVYGLPYLEDSSWHQQHRRVLLVAGRRVWWSLVEEAECPLWLQIDRGALGDSTTIGPDGESRTAATWLELKFRGLRGLSIEGFACVSEAPEIRPSR